MKFSLPAIIFLAMSFSLFADEAGWTDLFADGTFSQWQHVQGKDVPDGWKIEGGIISRPKGGGDIVTKQSYQDFELTFEWKISEKGNSGVKYRTRGSLGLEYQVLDDAGHKDGKIPNHRTGSLYDLLAAPDSKPVKPVGEWNLGKIVAKGNRIEHWLNGERVIGIEIGSPEWTKHFQGSKYKKHEGFGTWAGPVLLQDHQDPVWYRNIRIRKLEAD